MATKFHLRGNDTEESIIRSAEESLQRLQTDHIDILLIHGAASENELTDERVLSAFEKLKKQGKYRFRGMSIHSNPHRVVKRAVESGCYDMIQLGFNAFDLQAPEKGIGDEDSLGQRIRSLVSLAAAAGLGVIAMKTLKTAKKIMDADKSRTGSISLQQAMLKWVLENKNVTSVVTEMLNIQQMEENLSVAGTSLSEEERKDLYVYVARNAKDYCHTCGTCQRHCPSRIPTTEILRWLGYHECYGKTGMAKALYSELPHEKSFLCCHGCGACEKACPYGVSVRKKLLEAHSVLSS